MRGFEADCNNGKGNSVACHQVAEFLSVVKNDFDKAGKLYDMNCRTRDHAPSCFNLGRFLRETSMSTTRVQALVVMFPFIYALSHRRNIVCGKVSSTCVEAPGTTAAVSPTAGVLPGSLELQQQKPHVNVYHRCLCPLCCRC